MKRLAILSDMHGKRIALGAVLEDMAQLGDVDGYWILGDLVGIGLRPRRCIDETDSAIQRRLVQRNTDRYVVSGARPYPSVREAEADSTLLPRLVEVARSFAWTQGYVTAAGWFKWLAAVPLQERMDLADDSRMLGVDVAPG